MKSLGLQERFPHVKGLLVLCALLLCSAEGTCSAQSYFSSFPSSYVVETIERYAGPIFPRGGIGSTFRSEIGTSYAVTNLAAAYLRGDQSGEFDLRHAVPLDEAPSRIEFYGDFRVWRFGLRGKYSYFQTENKAKNLGEVDFSGFSIGGDLDVIQRRNTTFGLAMDYHILNPKMHTGFNSLTFTGVDANGNPTTGSVTLNVTGQPPATAGVYLRFMPPAILGMPMHIRAFYNWPIGGSILREYGIRLVFRPQIYRFDLACKLGVGVTHLKFDNLPELSSIPTERWEVDMRWEYMSLDFAVYF